MKKTNKTNFVIRLIEGQTTDMKTFVAAVVILTLSFVICLIGQVLSAKS